MKVKIVALSLALLTLAASSAYAFPPAFPGPLPKCPAGKYPIFNGIAWTCSR
jgi:hypothetical protein